MKNILLPTILDADTVAAAQTALLYANVNGCTITLLLVKDTADSFSSSAVLRGMRNVFSDAQEKALELCRDLVSDSNSNLKIQTQYAISSPLVKNLLASLETDLIIMPESFRSSAKKLNRYCVQLLSNSRCPILNLFENSVPDLRKALYLENHSSKIQVQDLQLLINDRFPFRIVSQAKISAEEEASLKQLLAETVSRNNIDVLVATRKPEKIKLGKPDKKQFHEFLGLPVLSVYEEIT